MSRPACLLRLLALLAQNVQESKTLIKILQQSSASPAQHHHQLCILDWGSSTYREKGISCWSLQARGGPTRTFWVKAEACTLLHGTLPLAEEVRFPILSPLTSHGCSERALPCYTLTRSSTSVYGRIQCDFFTTESNNNNKRCSGIISTTFSVSKAIINGFLFYSPKRKKGLRSSRWLLPSAFPSQLSLPTRLGTCTMEKVRGGDIR